MASRVAAMAGVSLILALTQGNRVAASSAESHRSHLEKLQLEQSQRLTEACATRVEVSYFDLLQHPDLVALDDDVQFSEICSGVVRAIEAACRRNPEVNGQKLRARPEVRCRRASTGSPSIKVFDRSLHIFADSSRAAYLELSKGEKGWEEMTTEQLRTVMAFTDQEPPPKPSAAELERKKSDDQTQKRQAATQDRVQQLQKWYQGELSRIQTSSLSPQEKGSALSALAEEFRKRLDKAVQESK
jgi:hypothetical protein